jgi:hypothetical protein
MARVGIVVVVAGRLVEVVVVSLDVVVVSRVSAEQAVTTSTSTNKAEKRRYMVDLEMIVRSPSRDLPGTITV